MVQLQIACLGDFQVTLAGKERTDFQTNKSRALLVYLALEDRVHPRTELAQFLWPGYSEESARNSLRQSLHQLIQEGLSFVERLHLEPLVASVKANVVAIIEEALHPVGRDARSAQVHTIRCAHHHHGDCRYPGPHARGQ